MPAPSKEVRVILAIEAIQTSKNLSCQAAAKLYDVPESTIRDRMNGRPAA
jgi:transposase